VRKGVPPAATLNGVDLSRREWQLVNLIAEGHLHKQIGALSGLADSTVKLYLGRLYDKMRRIHPEVADMNLSVVLAQWVALDRCGAYCTNPVKANPCGICCALPDEGSNGHAVLGTITRDAGGERPARKDQGAADFEEEDGDTAPWDCA
jgi:DNA-binding CsgD family transcriptional regulator